VYTALIYKQFSVKYSLWMAIPECYAKHNVTNPHWTIIVDIGTLGIVKYLYIRTFFESFCWVKCKVNVIVCEMHFEYHATCKQIFCTTQGQFQSIINILYYILLIQHENLIKEKQLIYWNCPSSYLSITCLCKRWVKLYSLT